MLKKLLVGAVLASSLNASCSSAVNTMLMQIQIASLDKKKESHYTAYILSIRAIDACEFYILRSDMVMLEQIKEQQKTLAGR